jgi:hypothetical protein
MFSHFFNLRISDNSGQLYLKSSPMTGNKIGTTRLVAVET